MNVCLSGNKLVHFTEHVKESATVLLLHLLLLFALKTQEPSLLLLFLSEKCSFT